MSEKFTLDAEIRNVSGKKVKQLRRQGLVPAVIYGLDKPENIQLDALKTTLALRDASSSEVFTLNLDGQTRKVFARETQRHVVRRDLIHIDFQEVDEESTIRASIPLKGLGRSVPESNGLGRTLMVLRAVDVEATINTIVSEIEVDLSVIDKPSRVLRVRDIQTPEGLTIRTHPDVTVAKFAVKRGEAAAEEEGAVAEVVAS